MATLYIENIATMNKVSKTLDYDYKHAHNFNTGKIMESTVAMYFQELYN